MKLKQVGLAVDRLLNVVVCWGSAQETMSSHCWHMKLKGLPWGRCVAAIDFLFSFGGPDHCQSSYEAERRRWVDPSNEAAP